MTACFFNLKCSLHMQNLEQSHCKVGNQPDVLKPQPIALSESLAANQPGEADSSVVCSNATKSCEDDQRWHVYP